MNALSNWLGQVTTGHGAMILGPTLLAAFTGQMTWLQALPLIVAGIVGLLWPENTGLKTASQNATVAMEGVATTFIAAEPALESVVQAYLKGVDHGNAAASPPATPAPAPVPATPVTGAAS